MRCLSPVEVEKIFSTPKFTVSLEHAWYRSALILDPMVAKRQARVGAQQLSDINRVPDFVRTLNRWLPSNQVRLFWVDHWDTGLYGGFENAIATATWRGLGETRSPDEAPGLLLDVHDWDEQDQAEISPAQAEATGLLVGLVAALMMTQSDGWLIAAGCADRIEFWEGHFFFYSADTAQIQRATEIVDKFNCRRWVM